MTNKITLPDNVIEPYLFLKRNDGDICYGYVTTDHGGIMIVLTDLSDKHDTLVPCGYVREYVSPIRRRTVPSCVERQWS